MFEPEPSAQGRGGRRARRLNVEGDRTPGSSTVASGGRRCSMIEKSFFQSAKATTRSTDIELRRMAYSRAGIATGSVEE